MIFPENFTVLAMDEKKNPVANVAIVLVLFPQKKNNYHVGPIITDQTGAAHFKRQDVEEAIARAREMFVMDYSGDLQDCLPKLDIQLHPPSDIARMLEQYEKSPQFWGSAFNDPERLFLRLRSTVNDVYKGKRVSLTEEQILKTPQVVLRLESTREKTT